MESGGKTRGSFRDKRSIMILSSVVVVAVVVIGGFAFFYQAPRAQLIVHDGSTTGLIHGDFLDLGPSASIHSYFNATSTAERPGHPESVLTLQVIARTSWDEDNGAVETIILVTVLGRLDSNLSAREIRVELNQTAYNTAVDFMETQIDGVNVSLEGINGKGFWDNSSGTMTASLDRDRDSSPYFWFWCSNYIHVWALQKGYLQERFLGIHASLIGWFEPEFSVGVLLKIVNTSTPS